MFCIWYVSYMTYKSYTKHIENQATYKTELLLSHLGSFFSKTPQINAGKVNTLHYTAGKSQIMSTIKDPTVHVLENQDNMNCWL